MFIQPELPYKFDALKPFISEEQLEYHYKGHQANYFKKLNELTKDHNVYNLTLDELIVKPYMHQEILNNALQAWNHTFFWNCMKPNCDVNQISLPSLEFEKAFNEDFGCFTSFITHFMKCSEELFGSGWCWLVWIPDKHLDKTLKGNLDIAWTDNADNPIREDEIPLLCIDLWEHAYYIDYRNKKQEYIENFMQIINWDFVEENYRKATGIVKCPVN
jgi:Fe-Mn family superoxide dismutase